MKNLLLQRLVSNGCSYMWNYALGKGHQDLAKSLNIKQVDDLSKCGATNDRIFRTTIRDSLHTDIPTLYLLGLTFLSRTEYPIDFLISDPDGPWFSMQNSVPNLPAHPNQIITDRDMQDLYRIKQKMFIQGGYWYFDNFCLHLISLINDLKSRGHRCLVFMNAEMQHLDWIDDERFKMLFNYSEIIEGLKWLAIPWQHQFGVPGQQDDRVPPDIQHRVSGEHGLLNSFILEYLKNHPEIYILPTDV